ncbi:peptigoglycan-binding protein LysM [Pseudomonas sp. Bc-h]|uniref:peptidoglycan DD-metalloendopeptidase family protein n=1 Tax=Pseudomonas sp. Bc-h TaxID=1943632 RepID=UPI0009DA6E1B|nr:peptidoglycan DD-metalloendopeptidase family protein [Pseudomonas sp. Bc-h]OQR32710.1 peptigoglycan-binding protein LysM [Pseudomonas sp. Bc-h]
MSLTVIRQRTSSTSFQRLVIGIALSVLLVGCSSTPSGGVRVVDRNGGKSAAPVRQPVTTGQYVVKRGDTLFSIAFRYGWDWKALAARNNIPEPYTIHVGQAIRFDGRSNSTSAVVAAAPVVVPQTTTSSSNSPSGSLKTTVITRPVGATSGSTAPPATTPVTTPVNTPVVAGARSASGWAWPTNGILIGKFSSNGSLNKGIDIAGDLGQPVLAASDGSVVYAGSGLRGYGELVIIKHSDTYVSAYGHNRRLLVREGQQVKAGQTIAEMGSTGTDRVKLHFEIRRQGKPVDPLEFLPRR